MKSKSYFFSIALVILFVSCERKNYCKDASSAKLIDARGTDACTWIFVLFDGSKIEPTNLDDFSIDYTDGKQYKISYHTVNQFSACMVGKVVAIDCVSEDK